MHRPPPVLLAAYRLLGWRLGPTYRDWVHADVTGRGWFVRVLVPPLVVEGALAATLAWLLDGDPGRLLPLLVVVLGGLGFLRSSVQGWVLAHHDADPRHNLRDTAGGWLALLAVLVLVALRR